MEINQKFKDAMTRQANKAVRISLSHYLANMGCEVPEIKMPFVPRWFQEIDPKCYTFLEPSLTGVRIRGVGGFPFFLRFSKNQFFPEKVKN